MKKSCIQLKVPLNNENVLLNLRLPLKNCACNCKLFILNYHVLPIHECHLTFVSLQSFCYTLRIICTRFITLLFGVFYSIRVCFESIIQRNYTIFLTYLTSTIVQSTAHDTTLMLYYKSKMQYDMKISMTLSMPHLLNNVLNVIGKFCDVGS